MHSISKTKAQTSPIMVKFIYMQSYREQEEDAQRLIMHTGRCLGMLIIHATNICLKAVISLH